MRSVDAAGLPLGVKVAVVVVFSVDDFRATPGDAPFRNGDWPVALPFPTDDNAGTVTEFGRRPVLVGVFDRWLTLGDERVGAVAPPAASREGVEARFGPAAGLVA